MGLGVAPLAIKRHLDQRAGDNAALASDCLAEMWALWIVMNALWEVRNQR